MFINLPAPPKPAFRFRGRIDHGLGLDDYRLEGLFDRFQRSDSGSGLGLAIARHVVERHGGTIRVQTKTGSGSTFTIELPPG